MGIETELLNLAPSGKECRAVATPNRSADFFSDD